METENRQIYHRNKNTEFLYAFQWPLMYMWHTPLFITKQQQHLQATKIMVFFYYGIHNYPGHAYPFNILQDIFILFYTLSVSHTCVHNSSIYPLPSFVQLCGLCS